MELFTEKEKMVRELQLTKRYWQKERKKKDAKYSDYYIDKQVAEIEKKIKELQ